MRDLGAVFFYCTKGVAWQRPVRHRRVRVQRRRVQVQPRRRRRRLRRRLLPGTDGKRFMSAVIRLRRDGDDVLISFEKRHRVRIAKLDAERQMVFGWANVCVRCSGETVVDSHDDTIAGEDLETAAYDFNLHFRTTGEDHEGVAKGRLIESFFVTPEKLAKMGLKKDALPVGWWIGFKIDDRRAWERVKKGDHRMFSIQGKARRERV